jgi:hypothetical protein
MNSIVAKSAVETTRTKGGKKEIVAEKLYDKPAEQQAGRQQRLQ